MKSSIFALALMGLVSSVSAASVVVEMVNFAEWGADGGATLNDVSGSRQAYFVPDADAAQGGTSVVLAPDESLVGFCPFGDESCVDNWNIAKTQSSAISIASKLKVTDFVPSSMMGKGWASAGWWLYPVVNAKLCAADLQSKAMPFGLDKSGTIVLDMSYTKGQNLTIQFAGRGIDENDPNQSPPRYTYTGLGYHEQVKIKVAQFVRESWSNPKFYDHSSVIGIGFLRLVSASTQGASFPVGEPTTTDFEIWSAILPSTYPSVESIPNYPGPLARSYPGCSSTSSQKVLLDTQSSVELLDLKGEILGKGLMSSVKQGLTPGSYLLRQGNSVESLVIQ